MTETQQNYEILQHFVLFILDLCSIECKCSVSFKDHKGFRRNRNVFLFSPLENEIVEYDNLNPEPESILDDLIVLDYVDKDDIKEEGKFK